MRTAALMLALVVLPASGQEIYDLVLKGGHVIDPKNGRNVRLDIAITGERIRRIAPAIPAIQARSVVDVSDYLVTPGLIDLHAYVAPGANSPGVVADHNTLRYGVTTVVDAGSSGWKNFEKFKADVIDPATVRILAFLNLNGAGLTDSGSEGGTADNDAVAAAQLVKKHPQLIVGVRAAYREQDGVGQAIKVAESTRTIIMADSRLLPGAMRAGDISTFVYSRTAPPQDRLMAARKKGIIFDVGHGSEGLWFRVAVPAIKAGFLPDVISTGIDSKSIMLPRANMTNVMSKFLAMGLTLDQVIERTTTNAAKAIRRTDLGSLEEGGVADIAVFELRKGRFAYLDSGHARLPADRELRCVLTIRNGEVVWDTEGLSLTDWKNAGPYSNFK